MKNDVERLPKSALRSGGWLAITGMVGALGVYIWMTTARGLDWGDWMIATIPLAIFEILVFVGWLAALHNRKGRLPTLTRIAVGIMLVVSALGMVMALAGIIMSPSYMWYIFFFPPWALLCLPIAPAVFIALKEKWAWWAAIAAFVSGPIFLFIQTFWAFHLYTAIYPIVTAAIPLILVIIDVKNYWKMTEGVKTSQPPGESDGQ